MRGDLQEGHCYASRAQKPHFCVKTTKNLGKIAHSDTKTPILCSKGQKMGVPKPKSAQKCRFCARRSTEQHGAARRGREQPLETGQDRLGRSVTARSTTKRNRHATQPQRNEHNTRNLHGTQHTQRNRHATAQWGTTKKETTFRVVSFKNWRLPTLPHGSAVPSAQVSLSSLFGMGRGGSSPLLPP